MSERYLVPVQTVIGHEQPARPTLLDGGRPVRKSDICGLIHDGMGKLEKRLLKRAALPHGPHAICRQGCATPLPPPGKFSCGDRSLPNTMA
jgi:hypothetical protein